MIFTVQGGCGFGVARDDSARVREEG